MPRSIKSASGGNTFVNTLTPRQGGTGAENVNDALAALNAFKLSELGAPNGIAKLTASGGIDADLLAGLSLNEACVDGPMTIQVNTAHDYFLTTYDSFEDYTVTATAGTVTRDKNVITYTAGSVAEVAGFTVNGRKVSIVVTDGDTTIVATPSIVAPVSGVTGLTTTQTLTASAFVMVVGTDTHASSDWEVATDAAFTAVAFSNYNDLLNLTAWTVTNMQPSTKYYVRTRQKSSGGKLSDWSAVSNFTTKTLGLAGTEQAKLLAGDPGASSYFGHTVNLSSDGAIALVGAYTATVTHSSQGAVYVFIRDNGVWSQQAKLLASDPAVSGRFGSSVKLSSNGDVALIGAYGDASGRGAAYVFVRSGGIWTQQAKLTSSDPGATDQLGWSVSLSGDGSVALVGAPDKPDALGSQQGAAYVFTRSGSTWAQQAKLLAGDTAPVDYFGISVSLSSDGAIALIGAGNKSGSAGNYQGAAYVFVRSSNVWSQQAKLLASDAASADYFGWSVSLSPDGNTALIGAYYKTGTAGSGQGAAYVFTRSGVTWSQQAKLLAGDPTPGSYFGWSVSLSYDGGVALVGEFFKSVTASQQGAAYVFTRLAGTWTQQVRLLESDPSGSDRFGISVSLSSDGAIALIGADNKSGSAGNYQGAAYVKI